VIEKQLKKWFSTQLLDWHATQNKRTMPWKGIKDAYRIWLSEIILQQTRVQQGLDYYRRFTEKFPNIHALAAADETLIFKLWEGLGYYSRCRNLIITAKYISKELGGQFPQTQEGLLALKGVGNYTAAAIGSFAFGLPLAVVDGNVMRVLSRFLGIKEPIDQPAGKKIFEQHAAEMLGKADPALYNQAIMDLGATICKPQQPDCQDCPLRKKCHARVHDTQSHFPVKSKKILQKNRFIHYLLVEADGSMLVRQRKGKDIWQDLYEFVLIEKDEPADEADLKKAGFWGGSRQKQTIIDISGPFIHQLTHQKIHARFVHVKLEKKIPWEGYEWMKFKKIKSLAFPRLISRYLDRHFL
jgi:A/G-specific adenine glycosylase